MKVKSWFFEKIYKIEKPLARTNQIESFPSGSDSKESAHNVEDPGSILRSGRSHGERNGYPLQYSCLENSMGRGAGWATVHGLQESQIRLDLTK